jgi:hypothetical protein
MAGNKPPLPALETGWQREKSFHALNANILRGSVRSRAPCSGGAVADIGAVIALALLPNRAAGARGGILT